MKFNRNIRDCKRRFLVEKYELRRNFYKAFWQDQNLPSEIRDKFRYKLSKLPRSSSHTRVRTRCIYTARPRAVYKDFHMSRIVFRTLAKQGELKGVQKASW
nr:type 1 ribosomal protein S10 [Sedum plumbizincicola]